MTLQKLYEDEHILAINKPEGVIVNTSQTAKSITVQEMVESDIDTSDADEESEFFKRGGVVHRIDKDTSGVLLIAKNQPSFDKLQDQFKSREVKKEYVAWILGKFADDLVEINAPIIRHPKVRTKFALAPEGKPAFTQVETIEVAEKEGEITSKVLLRPLTGRTHQLRVHLTAANHPIIGDPIYMTKRQFEKWHDVYGRMLLHAHKLTFVHPVTNEEMLVLAELPKFF